MASTLDKLKQLSALKLPAKFLLPVLEIIEGVTATRGPTRKRRKRRTKEQMAADAAKTGTKKKAKL